MVQVLPYLPTFGESLLPKISEAGNLVAKAVQKRSALAALEQYFPKSGSSAGQQKIDPTSPISQIPQTQSEINPMQAASIYNLAVDAYGEEGAKQFANSYIQQQKLAAREAQQIRAEQRAKANEEKQVQDYLSQFPQESQQPNAAQEVGPTPVEQSPQEQETKEEVDPILFSQQVPKPVTSAGIAKHSGELIGAKKYASSETKDYRQKVSDSAESAHKQAPLLKKAKLLGESGKVSGFGPAWQAKLGQYFPNLKGADIKEMERIMKEVTVDRFTTDFGGRPSASEFFYLSNIYAKPGDPAESIVRNIEMQEALNNAAIQKKKIMDEEFAKHKEWPLNIDTIVNKRMEAYQEKFLNDIGYYKWALENPKQVEQLKTQEQKTELLNSLGF